MVVVGLLAPVKHGAGIEFFAVSTDVAIGLLITDVLVAGAVRLGCLSGGGRAGLLAHLR